MKILFVSMIAFENNTSATIQNKGIIKGLIELGLEVDTLTLMPNKNAVSYDESMNDINDLISNSYYIEFNRVYAMLMAKKQKPEEIKANKNENKNGNIVKYILKKVRSFIKKIYDNMSIFDAQKYNVRKVSKLNIDYNKYDIIISSSDPKSSHLIVDRIFKKNRDCKAKWIQYWGDPMLIDITRKNDWRDNLVKYHEKKLISKADRIIYASPLTLKRQKEIFCDFAFKMDYANQGHTNIQTAKDKNDITGSDIDLENIKFGYFGAYMSNVRNIIPLYNAAIEEKVYLDICGGSDILLESTNNINVYGEVSYDQVIKMEKATDVLVSICNKRGTQIPGKIYYWAGYNKPIIVILDGEYKEELKYYLNDFDRYILCENNKESIINAILKAKKQLARCEYIINKQLTPKYIAEKILGEVGFKNESIN